jgi:hypothetical protein
MDVTLRAWPLTLHMPLLMYIHIHNANVDAGKPPTHCPKPQTRMKSDFGSLKLLAHVRDMQGGLYIIRQLKINKNSLTSYFSLVSDEADGFEK